MRMKKKIKMLLRKINLRRNILWNLKFQAWPALKKSYQII